MGRAARPRPEEAATPRPSQRPTPRRRPAGVEDDRADPEARPPSRRRAKPKPRRPRRTQGTGPRTARWRQPETAKPLGAELEALRTELDERLHDLQRVTAEYANYRKRVERDRGLVAEQVTGAVLVALLPILDDLDRARDHGDLVGPFGAVAEQLTAALTKFGLNAFGEVGDRFDPSRHEAVAHRRSRTSPSRPARR